MLFTLEELNDIVTLFAEYFDPATSGAKTRTSGDRFVEICRRAEQRLIKSTRRKCRREYDR